MAAQQQVQWSSAASQQELQRTAARLSQGSEQLLQQDLERLAALADLPASPDPETERKRLGARHCLEELTAGRQLPTFDCELTDGTPLASQQWTQRVEYVVMQVKMRLNDMAASQEQAQEVAVASLEAARQAARASTFSERRLERAWLPASDYYRHYQDSAGWLERCSLRSSYWMRMSPKYLFKSVFAGTSPPMFLTSKVEREADVPDIVSQLTQNRRLLTAGSDTEDE